MHFFVLLLIMACSLRAIGQSGNVGIGTTTPHASAALDITSSDKGILIPRVDNTAAVVAPASGLLVYDNSSNGFKYFDGTNWKDISTGTLLQDADGDTKVQVEKTPDADIINFEAKGNSRFRITADDVEATGLLRVVGPFASGAGTNMASGAFSIAVAGERNLASGPNSFQGGGKDNTAGGDNAFAGGGGFNNAMFSNSFIGGGVSNTTEGTSSFIGAGTNNTTQGSRAFIGGGDTNTATGWYSFIGGGKGLLTRSHSEAAFGSYNTDYTATGIEGFNIDDRLFVIGNGLSKENRSDAVTVWKNGSVGIGVARPGSTLEVGGIVTAHAFIGDGSALTGINLSDADGDTRIQLEKNADEDVIRFDVAGAERMKFDGNTLHITPASSGSNLFIGRDAGVKNTSSGNTFLGSQAGMANTSGDRNTFIGQNAGLVHSQGRANVYIGSSAGAAENESEGNVMIGFFAGTKLTKANDNTFMGKQAGENVLTGGENTYIGKNAGRNNITGGKNVFLGFEAGSNETGSNKLYIDNSNTATPLIWGDFSANRLGVNRVATTNTLEVGGNASKATAGDWLANSDARLKTNIRPLDAEAILQKMLRLQGVNYEWNDTQTGTVRPAGIMYGFTAQNIQEVFPELVTADNLGFLQTAYGTYDAMYVESLRALNDKLTQQQTIIDHLQTELSEMGALKAANTQLQQEGDDLRSRLDRLEAAVMGSAQK